MRGPRLAALRLSLAALAAIVGFYGAPTPLYADSTSPPDEPHATVLASFLSAWQSGDVDRLMTHFAPTAAISWASDWSHGTGHLFVRTWINAFLQERGTLTGHLDRSDGPHATWRLSRRIPADIRLGLPPQDSIVEVELRDGRILALSQRADPLSRERYSRAIQALHAQHPAFSTAPPAVAPISSRTTSPSPITWIVATAACTAITLTAAFARCPLRQP
jgi:hypothetical protein